MKGVFRESGGFRAPSISPGNCAELPRASCKSTGLSRIDVARRQVDQRIRFVERDTWRIAASGDSVHCPAQRAALHGDAFVRSDQMLLAMERDRALAGLRFIIARLILPFLDGAPAPRLEVFRFQPAHRPAPAAAGSLRHRRRPRRRQDTACRGAPRRRQGTRSIRRTDRSWVRQSCPLQPRARKNPRGPGRRRRAASVFSVSSVVSRLRLQRDQKIA